MEEVVMKPGPPGYVRRKKRPPLSPGQPINSVSLLVMVLEEEPSVWWRGKARPSAFFLSWPLRSLLHSLRKGHFSQVDRGGGDADGE